MKNWNSLQVTVTMALFIVLIGCATLALAVEEHSAQALEHANAAASHGKMGHAAVLTEHAKESLTHAEAAENVLEGGPKAHMTEGIAHLKEAIKHGEMGHAKVATDHTNEALTHINASIGGS